MKKNLIIGMVVGFAILVGGAGITMAQTSPSVSLSASIQAEIQSLLSQVQALQQELAGITGSGSTGITTAGGAFCHVFPVNLSIGNSGSEVTALQTALQNQGFSVPITGTFDPSTAAAVTAFQNRNASQILAPVGLTTGTGYVGNQTRAVLNNLFRCTTTVPPVFNVASINPTAAPIGTTVTITGSGFAATGNDIHFGSGGIANVSSADGTHLTFQVPSSVGPCDIVLPGTACATYEQMVTPGTYSVSVSNYRGTTNSVNFTVGPTVIGSTLPPSISALNPNDAPVTTFVTITGTGFAATGNNVHFGNGGVANLNSSDGTHITFQVPTGVGPCDLIVPGSVTCSAAEQQVTPGAYSVYVSNNLGTSNTLTFIVLAATNQ